MEKNMKKDNGFVEKYDGSLPQIYLLTNQVI